MALNQYEKCEINFNGSQNNKKTSQILLKSGNAKPIH